MPFPAAACTNSPPNAGFVCGVTPLDATCAGCAAGLVPGKDGAPTWKCLGSNQWSALLQGSCQPGALPARASRVCWQVLQCPERRQCQGLMHGQCPWPAGHMRLVSRALETSHSVAHCAITHMCPPSSSSILFHPQPALEQHLAVTHVYDHLACLQDMAVHTGQKCP